MIRGCISVAEGYLMNSFNHLVPKHPAAVLCHPALTYCQPLQLFTLSAGRPGLAYLPQDTQYLLMAELQGAHLNSPGLWFIPTCNEKIRTTRGKALLQREKLSQKT